MNHFHQKTAQSIFSRRWISEHIAANRHGTNEPSVHTKHIITCPRPAVARSCSNSFMAQPGGGSP
jgi:hypothetical protein